MTEFIYPPFLNKNKVISVENLMLPRAKDFARILLNSAGSNLYECYLLDGQVNILFAKGDEIIVFDVWLEIGQRAVNDIRDKERLAVHFSIKDDVTPWVYALRKDFPNLKHLNSMGFKNPKCLCIYETRFEELILEWRSFKFLQDIKTWLVKSADGTLDPADRAREGFLVTTNNQILFLSKPDLSKEWFIYSAANSIHLSTFYAFPSKLADYPESPHAFVYHRFHLLQEVPLGFLPKDFFDLKEFVEYNGVNFELFWTQVIDYKLDVLRPAFRYKLNCQILFYFEIPRGIDDGIMQYEHFAFATKCTVEEICLATQYFVKESEQIIKNTRPLVLSDQVLAGYPLWVLIVHFGLNRDKAKELSPDLVSSFNYNVNIGLIGAGALGSAIFANCNKKGIGQWEVIDHDILLPHNLIRHSLGVESVMYPKSTNLVKQVSMLLGFTDQNIGIWDNYLNPQDKGWYHKLSEKEIIIDVSTSIAVERDLAAREDLKGKCISMFLNPAGRDLVILAEDSSRKSRLDSLEFVYYRMVLHKADLSGHLTEHVSEVRYSGGCGDVSTRLPQEYIAIHGAIAAKKLESIITNDSAFACLWHISDDLSVIPFEIEIPEIIEIDVLEWKIKTDLAFLEMIQKQRQQRLPNETGGIIIGGYDLSRKIIYIVDTIPSPPDSEEYPNAYIRGIVGVEQSLDSIGKKTLNHLMYIGEWHSHPERATLNMSGDDMALLTSLKMDMGPFGFPGLILILGDDNEFKVYLKE
jgi:hypothetical protein